MARFTVSTLALALLAGSATYAAKPPQPPAQSQAQVQSSDAVLVAGLNAVASTVIAQSGVSPQVQPGSTDHDQGDDHASDTAILKVCNHDNPSATHSAICPQPNSPP